MSRNKQYDILWREKNRLKLRKYHREYKRKLRSLKRENAVLRADNYLKKGSTSYIGRKYELIAIQMLSGSVDCNNKTFSGGYDLLHKNRKVEVKMRRRKKNNWRFTFKETCCADWCILFCVSKDGSKIERILYQPYLKEKSISVDNAKEYKYECYNSKRCSLCVL